MPVPHQTPNNLPLASSLPKVSFRKIPDHEAKVLAVPAGVHDQHLINYGFNDGTEFEKPEHYLRYVEPIESELTRQVEYDMDEQDQEWLDALNADRRREQQDTISYEVFEVIIDRLEKEWFDLMKRVPPKPMPVALGPDGEPVVVDGNEDVACAICDDGECENSNAIVFCDGCNLAVHQDCYGIPYIPEGQWLCRKCTVSPDRAVSCVLCPHEGGAFKQTTQGRWAHLLCAMWIPETGVSNPVYMEPIDSVERIPKARWKLQCYICRRRVGACIQCENKNCCTAFHVTCARRAGLLLKTQRQRVAHTPDSDDDESGERLRAWCHKHLPKSLRAQRIHEEEFQDAPSQTPSPDLEPEERKRAGQVLPVTPARKKSARAYKKSYRAGPSLVPAYVVNRVVEHIARIHVRKKLQLVIQIAKFWSLKREARRGAPLLKRLHLEPWTANAAKKEQTDVERLKKLRFLLHLREDLEKVRMLAELVRKREKEKQRQAQVIRSALVESVLFPYNSILRSVLERIVALDRSSLFLNPVSAQTVPDYYDIVKRPMDWATISNKLDDLRYLTVEEFKADILLVLDNAMLYNKVDTAYHRTAARILHVAGPIFADLDSVVQAHGEETLFQLEPEQAVVDLLRDYTPQDPEFAPRGPDNAVDDMTRQFYQERTGLLSRGTESKALSAAPKNALEKRGRGRPPKKKGELDQGQKEEGKTAEDPSSDHQRQQSATNESECSNEDERRTQRTSDLPEPTHLEVNQVDSWDSFKRFNVGWVLPEGVKRSRVQTQTDRIGQSDHRLGRSQSLSTSLSTSLEEHNDGQAGQDDQKERKRKRTDTNSTPLNLMKRSRSASNVQQHGIARRSGAEVAQRRGVRRRAEQANNSISMDGQKEKRMSKAQPSQGQFELSTLCWAKMEGYPSYPAEIYNEGTDDVPQNVLKSKPAFATPEAEHGGPMHLVRFFDATRSFGWVPESKLRLLFEDPTLDERMLRGPTSSRQRSEVRKSFDRAKAQAE